MCMNQRSCFAELDCLEWLSKGIADILEEEEEGKAVSVLRGGA